MLHRLGARRKGKPQGASLGGAETGENSPVVGVQRAVEPEVSGLVLGNSSDSVPIAPLSGDIEADIPVPLIDAVEPVGTPRPETPPPVEK